MQTGHAVPSDVLDAAASTARHWHTIAVVPLRAARKGLATAPDAIDEAGRLALLAQVRRAELEAERLLIDALERLLADTVSNAESPLDALMAVAGAWGATPPQDRLADLVRVIETPVG